MIQRKIQTIFNGIYKGKYKLQKIKINFNTFYIFYTFYYSNLVYETTKNDKKVFHVLLITTIMYIRSINFYQILLCQI